MNISHKYTDSSIVVSTNLSIGLIDYFTKGIQHSESTRKAFHVSSNKACYSCYLHSENKKQLQYSLEKSYYKRALMSVTRFYYLLYLLDTCQSPYIAKLLICKTMLQKESDKQATPHVIKSRTWISDLIYRAS